MIVYMEKSQNKLLYTLVETSNTQDQQLQQSQKLT